MKTNYLSYLIILFLVVVTSCKKDNDNTPETVTDINGNVYQTVKIGNQIWMAENLKVTKLNDETAIPRVSNAQQWEELATLGYCGYENNQSYYELLGALYNWEAVNSGKLAPEGWHIPTDEEWAELFEFLGGENVASAKLKETGTANWVSPNADATNASGFTALPSGFRDSNGVFFGMNTYAAWWTATDSGDSKAWFYELATNGIDPIKGVTYKNAGFSVRCIKD